MAKYAVEDLELREARGEGGGDFVLLALSAFLPSLISSFYPT